MFISKDFLEKKEELKLEEFALKEKRIKKLGAKVTMMRKELNDAALLMEEKEVEIKESSIPGTNKADAADGIGDGIGRLTISAVIQERSSLEDRNTHRGPPPKKKDPPPPMEETPVDL